MKLKGQSVIREKRTLLFDLTAPPGTFFVKPLHQIFDGPGGGWVPHATMLGGPSSVGFTGLPPGVGITSEFQEAGSTLHDTSS